MASCTTASSTTIASSPRIKEASTASSDRCSAAAASTGTTTTFFALFFFRNARMEAADGSSSLSDSQNKNGRGKDDAAHTLVALRIQPPVPLMLISGCVLPGSAWCCRIHGACTVGPSQEGSARSSACARASGWRTSG